MKDTVHLLDFEKPIAELQNRLENLKNLTKDGDDKAVFDMISDLENKIEELKKKTYENLTRWQKVQLSRHPNRPYTLDYLYSITPDFLELHGDRLSHDDLALIGGFGKIDKQTFMFIGQQKGRNLKDRKKRNFGMANPSGYRKAARLMKLAEKFNIPVVTFIDTPGAYPGLEAEKQGQAQAIAENLQVMATLKVPIISIIIGEGASGGALGIGLADKVFMLENTWYSVISPESCSSILWRSWEYKEQAAEALKLTADDMLNYKIIDGIIKEPLGGAQNNLKNMAKIIKEIILKNFELLVKKVPQKRVEDRINKFEKMGVFNE